MEREVFLLQWLLRILKCILRISHYFDVADIMHISISCPMTLSVPYPL